MLILASASPRRNELLKKMGINFSVVPSNFNEEVKDGLSPEEYALNCAEGKAEDVFARYGGVILGVDTVVVADSQILGKPKDKSDAKKMLKQVCGREHSVISAFCLIDNDKKTKGYDKTTLFIESLTDAEIDEYIKSGSPMDKAGAYGLQDDLIKNKLRYIVGSRDNVIGFPTELLSKLLR